MSNHKYNQSNKSQFNQSNRQFNQSNKQFNQSNIQFNQSDSQFNQSDSQFNQSDIQFNQLDRQFNQSNSQFNQLDRQFNKLPYSRPQYDQLSKHKYKNNFNNYNNNNQINQSEIMNDTNVNETNMSDKIKREILMGDEIKTHLKNELLNYLYLNIDLYQLRYCILKTTEHAQIFKQQTYNISPHFHGYNYFLIIKKLSDGILSAYLVYRMDLKFNKAEVITNNVKIYNLKTEHIPENLNNSIFDGKLVFKKDEKIFLLFDVLYFKGQKLLNTKLIDKFDMLENSFDDFVDAIVGNNGINGINGINDINGVVNNINQISNIDKLNQILKNNFEVKFIKLYTYAEMSTLVYSKIKNSNFKINGLIFLPQRSGRIFIYMNDQEFENIKNSPNLNTINSQTDVKFPNHTFKEFDTKNLLLQKTRTIDVYEVFTVDKLFKFGIACVPDIKLSHTLKNIFKTTDQLITNCIFDVKFSKWRPILSDLEIN